MARWQERQGFTLRMPEHGLRGSTGASRGNAPLPSTSRYGGEAGGRYLRLSLIERSGLLSGLYNVRETRAEADDEVPIVSEGRALSWRWLRRKDAERLLEARLRTLEALGYALVDTSANGRGRWGWLQELLRRRISHDPSAPSTPSASEMIREALRLVGPGAHAVLEGVAALLDCSDEQLRAPHVNWLRSVDAEKLAAVLPFLVGHEDPDVREVGESCLRVPITAYQVPQSSLIGWLESERRIARVLGPRIPREGLALIGPDALVRLSHSAVDPHIRSAAHDWVERMSR